jgi:hypothetical protein
MSNNVKNKKEEEEKDILEYVDKELSNIDTGNIYKYITTNMGDELEELMKEYREESKDMSEDDKQKCHKIFTRLGILQTIKTTIP